jgi:hypothetical protein
MLLFPRIILPVSIVLLFSAFFAPIFVADSVALFPFSEHLESSAGADDAGCVLCLTRQSELA